MKNLLFSLLLLAFVCVVYSSCSNGAYSANPNGAANSGVNPLKPLTSSEFTWSGSGSISADINGVHFVADTATWFLDSSGTNVFSGYNATHGFIFYLNNVYSVNLYPLQYHIYTTQAAYIDSINIASSYYESYLGNSGQVKITENDSAYIKGLFYFQGVTTSGKLVTVKNGYFNIAKPIVH